MKNRFIVYLVLLFSILSLSSCGGGAGSSSLPPNENAGIPFSVTLIPSQTTAQTNASILLRAKVLDGSGVPMANVPVTFTNLSEPVGVIKSILRFVGLGKPKVSFKTAASTGGSVIVNTNGSGIASVSVSSTVSGVVTVQAEVNNAVGKPRDKKLVTFSDTFGLPVFSVIPQLVLDVDTTASFATPDDPNDFILLQSSTDNQRFIRATVFFDATISGKLITFGSDSADVTLSSGSVSGQQIEVAANSNGQATVLATVNSSVLSKTVKIINITAAAADGASSALTLFLEPVVINGSASSLSANPTTVAVGGTSTITANVQTNLGNAPDGTSVSFTTTCGTVDAFAQTTGGVATASFTAPSTVPFGGTCKVTGKVGGVTIGNATITVVAGLAVQLSPTTINGVIGGSVTGTISGGVSPYSVASSDPTLPASLTGSTFSVTVPADTPAKAVTYTVTDSLGNSVAASLTITGPSSLQIFPPAIPVVSASSAQTFTFKVSAGSPSYVMTSSDPTKAFNDDGSGGGTAGDGIRNGTEGGIWTSLVTPAFFTVTIPANVAAGTVTLTVFDSLGATATATITISGGGGAGPAVLTLTPASVSVSGIHDPTDTRDNITFLITNGTGPFNVKSDNDAIIASPGALGAGVSTFTVNPDSVSAATAVKLTVVDAVGTTATASVSVTPAQSAMVLNPSTIAVTAGTPVTFSIIGGFEGTTGFTVYSSNQGILQLSSTPLVLPLGTTTFTANTLSSGAAAVTVVDANNAKATATVTVNGSDFFVVPATVTIPVGETFSFTIFGGTNVATGAFDIVDDRPFDVLIDYDPTVDPRSFSVTGVNPATVNITVIDDNNRRASVNVTIE